MLFIGLGKQPLFVAMDAGFGGLKGASANGKLPPLTTQSAAVLLGKLYAKAGLAAPGTYAFRYMKGNMVKLVHSRDAQQEALHHCVYGHKANIGQQHYSARVQNILVSQPCWKSLTRPRQPVSRLLAFNSAGCGAMPWQQPFNTWWKSRIALHSASQGSALTRTNTSKHSWLTPPYASLKLCWRLQFTWQKRSKTILMPTQTCLMPKALSQQPTARYLS